MGEGRPGSDVDTALNSSAFQHMRATIAALITEGIYPPGDATMMALELWTAAHGVAALLISKPYLPWGDVEEFTDRVLRAVCTGQIVSGIIGTDLEPMETIARLKGLADEHSADDIEEGHLP